jgi:superfamily II DNA/RNA helicase
MRFDEMNLRQQTVDALRKMKYESPTEVQEKVIPLILNGGNLVVRSKTGTGKTAAFGIGIIERLASGSAKKALVLAPTRELAVQIYKEVKAIASNYPLKLSIVYGGVSINPQIDELRRGVDILIATPGRLLDHMERRTVSLHEFNLVILDEADRMLDMGFRDQMNDIMGQVPKERMVILLSATLDGEIMKVASSYMGSSEVIEIGEKDKPEAINEHFVEVARTEKITKLREILREHSAMKTIIFTSTKFFADKLADRLAYSGFRADRIQGDMSQAAREHVMQDFRENKIKILVATDVAARGLHIDDVGLIINYDKAADADTHLHRIGRTGRMGAAGKAITFVDKHETEAERNSEDHPDFAWMKRGDPYATLARRGGDSRPPRAYGEHSRERRHGQGGHHGHGEGSQTHRGPTQGGWKKKKSWQR